MPAERKLADVLTALMIDRDFALDFPDQVEREARAGAPIAATERRRDLSALTTFTIDPVDARDFDDAISVQSEGDGAVLYVHIADVSAYVPQGGAVDLEARRRGCSIYAPGRVLPMLPDVLSSDRCSLVAGQPRMTVTVQMSVANDGTVRSSEFFRSVITSDARLTYQEVDDALSGKRTIAAPVGERIEVADAIARALKDRRASRGALTLVTDELEFELDSQGDPTAAQHSVQSQSHGLIEELMIAANEQVARYLEKGAKETLYRVHPHPAAEAFEFLLEQLASLDLPTPALPDVISPLAASELAGQVSESLQSFLTGRSSGRAAFTGLLLRSLQQAYYSPKNIGHSGLASPTYCHFTSPIRRYPDLVVHRALLASLGFDDAAHAGPELESLGWHCSASERTAMSLERTADDICSAYLLKRELDQAGYERLFEGEVVGMIRSGAFVRFGTCEGFLPARRIPGGYLKLNAEATALVSRDGVSVRLGDPIDVCVDKIEWERGRVDLVPAPVGKN